MATLQSASDAAGAVAFEFGHLLSLVESNVVRGRDLDRVEFFAVLFEGSLIQQWLDGCCSEMAEELAASASAGHTHVVATRRLLATGAERLFKAGRWASREFELNASEFVFTSDLWKAACAVETDALAAETATINARHV